VDAGGVEVEVTVATSPVVPQVLVEVALSVSPE
jgi:hypothetical protein